MLRSYLISHGPGFFWAAQLPRVSRSLGKNLAEFRRASEDFKQTWEREVALEDFQAEPQIRREAMAENSIMDPLVTSQPADSVIARGESLTTAAVENVSDPSIESATPPEAPRKQDWL